MFQKFQKVLGVAAFSAQLRAQVEETTAAQGIRLDFAFVSESERVKWLPHERRASVDSSLK